MSDPRPALCAIALLTGAVVSCGSNSGGAPASGADGSVDSGAAVVEGGSKEAGLLEAGSGGDGEAVPGDDAEVADAPSGEAGSCPFPPEVPAPNCFSSFALIGSTAVTTQCMGGTPPAAQGGAVPGGTYQLQSRIAYGTPCQPGPARDATIVICPGEWGWVIVYDADGGGQSTYTYNYVVTPGAAPNSLVLTPRCTSDLDMTVDNLSYSYAGGQLTLISANTVSVYAKQ